MHLVWNTDLFKRKLNPVGRTREAELAFLLGVSRVSVTRVLEGTVQALTVKRMVDLCVLFSCGIAEAPPGAAGRTIDIPLISWPDVQDPNPVGQIPKLLAFAEQEADISLPHVVIRDATNNPRIAPKFSGFLDPELHVLSRTETECAKSWAMIYLDQVERLAILFQCPVGWAPGDIIPEDPRDYLFIWTRSRKHNALPTIWDIAEQRKTDGIRHRRLKKQEAISG